ncbi:hypothetical protein AYJ54_01860 [Bradyrhizobium centrolobii]|uniref:Uncharacterized protein n=1 Tax=Bradyrhizobium centrolobii TaxID=1505087 RepID=A0A176YGA7_9BRAD|nr:hypothetical protein AYJ54_01860 [Bradyrhizobium centrolobii]
MVAASGGYDLPAFDNLATHQVLSAAAQDCDAAGLQLEPNRDIRRSFMRMSSAVAPAQQAPRARR